MKRYIYLLTMIFASCLEPIEWSGANEPTNTLVVSGGITSDTTSHTILLYRSQGVIVDTPAEPVSGAIVTLEVGSTTHQLVETISGTYQTDPNVFGLVGQFHTLRVEVDNEIHEAVAEMIPLGISPEPIEILQHIVDPPGLPSQEVIEYNYRPNFGSDVPARYNIKVKLPENIRALVAAGLETPRWLQFELERDNFIVADSSYYLHPSLEPPAFFAYGETNESRLSIPGTQVIEEYQSMTEEHYSFVRSVLSESEWRGLGPFGYIPGNAVGNISNGAFGYFYASEIVRLVQIPIEDQE